jgi:hypothetical protein
MTGPVGMRDRAIALEVILTELKRFAKVVAPRYCGFVEYFSDRSSVRDYGDIQKPDRDSWACHGLVTLDPRTGHVVPSPRGRRLLDDVRQVVGRS